MATKMCEYCYQDAEGASDKANPIVSENLFMASKPTGGLCRIRRTILWRRNR